METMNPEAIYLRMFMLYRPTGFRVFAALLLNVCCLRNASRMTLTLMQRGMYEAEC